MWLNYARGLPRWRHYCKLCDQRLWSRVHSSYCRVGFAAAFPPCLTVNDMSAVDLLSTSHWPGLEKFNVVQDYLEKNKLLITEINNNHEIRTPDGLARNVYLIRELNSNVSKVVELYKELSTSLEQHHNQNGVAA